MTRQELMLALQNGLLGTPETYGGLLDSQQQSQARNNGMMNFGAAMLANSGPSRTPVSFGQALGQSVLQGRSAQAQSTQDAINAALLKKQLTQKQKKDLVPVVKDGSPQYVNAEDAEGLQPFSMTSQSAGSADLQAYNQALKDGFTGTFLEFKQAYTNASALPGYSYTDVNGVPTRVVTRAPVGTDLTPQPLTTVSNQATGQATVAGAVSGAQQVAKEAATTEALPGQVGAKTQAERSAAFIDTGLAAADSLPVVNRALELLDTVKTGGIDAAKLAATNFFGVTGADESELSNNLGKAVLSQLRSTFGAAFTEKEGERLSSLEAGFGKSTEGNKRILGQVKQIVERAARRGLDAAKKTNDQFSAEEIERSLNMDIGPKPESKAATKEWQEGGYLYRRLPDGTVQRKKK